MRQRVWWVGIVVVLLGLNAAPAAAVDDAATRAGEPDTSRMVFIRGGTFAMGDVFGGGRENELPVHDVTLDDFYLAICEVTVGQFGQFVAGTGYQTSAEAPEDPELRKTLEEKSRSGTMSREERKEVYRQLLQLPGTGRWFTDTPRWGAHDPQLNWRNPGFGPQADDHPVVAVSWNDAAHFCNWLSRMAGFPEAYDLETGSLVDEDGNPTDDVSRVRGYRLPTEAEWEYAAREGGRRVRFGTGQDTARSSEINFRADTVTSACTKRGLYRRATTPVGLLRPNSLGLYDMSGNAWEWVSDCFVAYTTEKRTNPHATDCDMRALRGGRWGGDAFSIRVSDRSGWHRNDRCNNSGFRVARSAN